MTGSETTRFLTQGLEPRRVSLALWIVWNIVNRLNWLNSVRNSFSWWLLPLLPVCHLKLEMAVKKLPLAKFILKHQESPSSALIILSMGSLNPCDISVVLDALHGAITPVTQTVSNTINTTSLNLAWFFHIYPALAVLGRLAMSAKPVRAARFDESSLMAGIQVGRGLERNK